MRAIQITEFGSPEVLVLRELDDPEPPEGFVVLDVLAAGVNWADTHQAENSYLAAAELPLVPGGEVVGTTPEGKRVVALLNGGGYAERAIAHPSLMWEVPNGVSDAQALAMAIAGNRDDPDGAAALYEAWRAPVIRPYEAADPAAGRMAVPNADRPPGERWPPPG